MQTKIEQRANIDPEARLLARVYALILSWGEMDEPNELREPRLTRQEKRDTPRELARERDGVK